jgi:predicted ester cyclase
MELSRDELRAFYDRYLSRCNTHRFDDLGEFVAQDVNGVAQGLGRYAAGLQEVVEAFPDYRWELEQLLVDGPWLAARLNGTGTHRGPFRGIAPTGRTIRLQELAMYRLADGRITHCWGDLDSALINAMV